jgi:hypothetical protein
MLTRAGGGLSMQFTNWRGPEIKALRTLPAGCEEAKVSAVRSYPSVVSIGAFEITCLQST